MPWMPPAGLTPAQQAQLDSIQATVDAILALLSTDYWTFHAMPGAGTGVIWRDVVYHAGLALFVTVGSDDGLDVGYCATSPDGATWTSRTIGNKQWRGITTDGTTLVAVGIDNNTGEGTSATSTDGTTWTLHSIANPWGAYDVVFAAGLFVAVANQAADPMVYTSPNGVAWTGRTSHGAALFGFRRIVYASGIGLFAAIGGTNGLGSICTSPDGITWTARTYGGSNALTASFAATNALGNVMFVQEDVSHNIVSSTDGITWTTQISNGFACDCAIWDTVANVFVVIGPGTATATSVAGPWTVVSTSTEDFQGVASNGTILVGIGGFDAGGDPISGVH